MEQQELEQEIDLMPHHQEVDPLDSADLEVKQVPHDQGDTKILGENDEGEMHNISFDESQHTAVHSCRLLTLDDYTYSAQFEE